MTTTPSCGAVNQATGEVCGQPAGHHPATPHTPTPPPVNTRPAAPKTSGRARVPRATAADKAVEKGLATRMLDGYPPPGTYPIRPKIPVVCAIPDCGQPGRLYLPGRRCDYHSPAATRLREQNQETQ